MNWNIWKNRPEERWALRLVLIFVLGIVLLGAADLAIFRGSMAPRGGDLRPLAQVTVYERGGGTHKDTTLTPLLHRGDRAVVHISLPRELSRPQAVLAFTAEHVCLRASWNGRVLDRYGMGDVAPYKLFGKVTRFVPIPDGAYGSDIVIEMTAMLPILSADPYQNACVEYGALFFLPLPFLTYLLLAEQDEGRRRTYGVLRIWFGALFVFAVSFQAAGVCSMKTLLPLLHITLFVAVFLVVWHRFHPLGKEPVWDILFRYGFLATFASVVLGMIQFYFVNYFGFSAQSFFANKVIASGLLIFLLTIIFCYVYRFVGQVMHSQENRIYKRMALQDMLTGLLSRAGVFDAVRSLRLSDHYAVLFFDVNGLKEANDLYGHATGDRLLRVTAATLEDIFQPVSSQNLCARVGGDEFLVVVRGEDLSRIESLCTAVRHQLESLAGKSGFPKDTSISCGISENNPDTPKAFEEHIKIADDRMYAAKNAYKRKKYGGRRASDRIFLRDEKKD